MPKGNARTRSGSATAEGRLVLEPAMSQAGQPMGTTRIELVTISWNLAIVSFALDHVARVDAHVTTHEREVAAVRTRFREMVGQIHLGPLPPSTECELVVSWDCGEWQRKFRTLPHPQGRRSWAAVVFGDPHVADASAEKHGRLLIEADWILRRVVDEVNRLQVDYVLIPGDLTDQGTRPEYEKAADALSKLACPCLVVPGDHDMKGEKSRTLWREHFGLQQWVHRDDRLLVVGCDTSAGLLGQSGLEWIRTSSPQGKQPLLVLSHRQLVEDDRIVDPDKAVDDWGCCERVLRGLEYRGLVLAGHKNVPSSTAFGRFLQLNVPQPVQYQSGYLVLEEFENGLYVTFRPLFSEVLNEYSRRMGDECREPRLQGGYRTEGVDMYWNALYWAPDHG